MRSENSIDVEAGARPIFQNFLTAWRWWTNCVDREPLKAAIAPPANATRDEVIDAMLAVFFRHACEYPTEAAALHYVSVCNVTWRKTADAVDACGDPDEAKRLSAMCAVLKDWSNQLFEALPHEERTA